MRKLCWWAIPCSAAIFLAVYLLPQRCWVPAGAICAAIAPAGLLLHGKPRLRVMLPALGLAAGFLWTAAYTARVVTPTRALAAADQGVYTLRITDFSAPSSWGSVVDAEVLLLDGSRPRVRLYLDRATALRPGDIITCPMRFAPTDRIHGQRADYYPAKGVFLFGYADAPAELTIPASPLPLRFAPQYAAKALKESLSRLFPDDLSGFFIALLTGDKSAMPTGMYAAFQRAGIAHVVVVSGLHIGFLALAAAWVLGKRSRVCAGATVAAVFFFAMLAGGTHSAFRAAIMASLALLAPLAGRETDKATTLSAALVLLLLHCPYAAASVSLQLSFGAVAGIYAVTERLQSRFWGAIPEWTSLPGRAARVALRFLGSSCAVSLGALVFSTPLAAVCFQTFSLAGPLTNLLVLWAVSVAFPLALFAVGLGALCPALGTALAAVAAPMARWVIGVARWVARWPYASLDLSFSPALPVWFWSAYLLVLVWLFCPRRIRPLLPISVLAVSLCAAVWYSGRDIRASTVTTVALDVGEGASTLFYSQGHTVLVDCGGNSQDDPGDTAADYVQALGRSHIDAVVLTHFHTDHTGGVAELFSRLSVDRLILPAVHDQSGVKDALISLAQRNNCEVIELYSDMLLPFGEATLQIYAPVSQGNANESGLSAVCRAGDYTALITGDMGSKTEQTLLREREVPDVDVLLVGHHGAKGSTSPQLLEAIEAETALISTGRNSYGHPAAEVVERLEQAGCEVLRTDELGTVCILSPPGP